MSRFIHDEQTTFIITFLLMETQTRMVELTSVFFKISLPLNQSIPSKDKQPQHFERINPNEISIRNPKHHNHPANSVFYELPKYHKVHITKTNSLNIKKHKVIMYKLHQPRSLHLLPTQFDNNM